MLTFISEILLSFYTCFSRTASFEWFVTIVVGLMIRSDSLGLTSIIRDLSLMPSLYPSLEYFFHASSWEWDTIFSTWAKIVAAKAPLLLTDQNQLEKSSKKMTEILSTSR